MLCRRNAGKRVKLATLEAVTGSRAAGFLCCEALTLTTLVGIPTGAGTGTRKPIKYTLYLPGDSRSTEYEHW